MKYVTTAVILIRIYYFLISVLALDAIESGLMTEVLNELQIYIYIYIYIQGVTGATDQTSGGCSLC